MKNLFLKQILSLLLALICSPVSGYAEDSYNWQSLTTTDGLSDLVVNALYKDTRGYVWIGTGSSLDRFDGVHIRSYRIVGNNEKLKRVNAITQLDTDGNNSRTDVEIWMGNGMGLWRVNNDTRQLERMMSDVVNEAVYALLSDSLGTLYIGSKKGLFLYRNGSVKHLLLDPNQFSPANEVHGLTLDAHGNLWMATASGLGLLPKGESRITLWHNNVGGIHHCAFNSIACIDSTLYLGTMEQGIIRFDRTTKQFAPYLNVGCNVISTLSARGGELYVGTDGGGAVTIDTRKHQLTHRLRYTAGVSNSIRSNSVYSLLVDRDGIIWVGFYQQGLDYTLFQNRLFRTYSYPPHFDSADIPIRALAMNGDEKLIGSRDGLFYIDESRHRFCSFHSPRMRSSMIFSICPYQGEYYVGTYGGGMYIFNPRELSLRDFPCTDPLPFQNGHIFCMEQDARGQLWIGTSQGLYCYKGSTQVAHYTHTNSQLPEGNVYEIFFDSTHKGWICTENGMCLWEPSSSTLRTDLFPEGFIHREKIRVVYEDSGHQLYFFPDKGALFRSDLSMNTFSSLYPGTPLDGRDGMFVMEDAENWLWIGTSNGLFHYDKAGHFVPYNFVDGIPSSIFTLCPPVCDAKGNFWFGNSKGLLYLDADRLKSERRSAYPVRITDVQVLGRGKQQPQIVKRAGDLRVEIGQANSNVTFCFADFTYTSPAFMAYEYRLEGEDEGWVAVSGASDVTYYNLSTGRYVFKVRRMGQPESETAVSVYVAWSISRWLVLVLVVVLGLSGLGYMWRVRWQRGHPSQNAETGDDSVPEVSGAEADEKYRTLHLSEDECKKLVRKLEQVMERDKLYKNPDLKIADLAQTIGTTGHTLSFIFNQHLKLSYYDYVNELRVDEFKRLVVKDDYARYTLSALAELCGFSSRASFFRSFKKATGITPSEYIKQVSGK